MGCSTITLSISTILSILAIACLVISFTTDDWYEYRLDRNKTRNQTIGPDGLVKPEFDTDPRYFNRDEGLFRTCFVDKKPKGVKTYLSPTQSECFNINYHIPEDEETDQFDNLRWHRLHMQRSIVALYIFGFFFLFLSFFTGLAGCWKRSHTNLVTTGILQLLAASLDTGSMALFHAVLYYDHHILKDKDSYANWPEELKYATETNYGWSYFIGWVGISGCLLAAIMFISAARCIRSDKRNEQAKNLQYLMPVYPDKRTPYAYNYAYPGTIYNYPQAHLTNPYNPMPATYNAAF
uniref:Claudin domain-containing protein 1 n=1 Tax=Aceria tosichella TaxID=561515 RepID=A0A6G1SEG3_9ACAR